MTNHARSGEYDPFWIQLRRDRIQKYERAKELFLNSRYTGKKHTGKPHKEPQKRPSKPHSRARYLKVAHELHNSFRGLGEIRVL